MSTFQEVINRVLTAIGQGDDLVSAAVTDTYQLKIAQFVNDYLEEVEGAAPWRVLRSRVSVTIAAGDNSAAISGTNERSELWYQTDQQRRAKEPLCYDVTTSTAQYRLNHTDLAAILALDQDQSNAANGSTPTDFAVEKTATGLTLYVSPRPSSERTIEIDVLIGQARLDPTDTGDLATAIKVPVTPVVLGASWWAMEDRGEELGPRGEKNEQRWLMALSDAVSKEMADQGIDELVAE